MIPVGTDQLIGDVGIPRESGDDPSGVSSRKTPARYSPRERG